MTRCLIEPKNQIFVKSYEFLSLTMTKYEQKY